MQSGHCRPEYTYRTCGIAVGMGIKREVADIKSGEPLAESADLSDEAAQQTAISLSSPLDKSLVRLRQ